MSASGWLPPAEERALGLEFYATQGAGVGGRLKQDPADFRVQEISAYPRPDPEGPVTVLRIESRGWEQHELTARLARELGVPTQGIRWAGTKDRRAVAERLLTYRGALPVPGQLTIPRVEVREAYRTRESLVLGHHYGNRFEILLRGLARDPADSVRQARSIDTELESLGGFPNFFGMQRFGEVRPITHLVGQALAMGDVARAVDIYLSLTPVDEAALGGAARRAYAEHHDPARALREFPPALQFERQILEHLARGQSAPQALRSLSRPLRTLFVHAYQAHLFNRYISRRHAAGLSLTEPAPGDWLLRVTRDGTVPGRDPVPVGLDNLAEARALAQEGKARLAGPLVGYDSPSLTGSAGAILDELLAADGVTREGFRLPSAPEIASAGNWRPFWCPHASVRFTPVPEAGQEGLRLAFHLPRGTYATVLLREFMKSGAAPASGIA